MLVKTSVINAKTDSAVILTKNHYTSLGNIDAQLVELSTVNCAKQTIRTVKKLDAKSLQEGYGQHLILKEIGVLILTLVLSVQ